MDPHVQWLRRFVLGRVARRLSVEGAVVAATLATLAALAGVDPLLGSVGAVVGAQVFGLLRLGGALALNPVDHRFLWGWPDRTDRLESMPSAGRADQPDDAVLARMGLSPLTRLGVGGDGRTTVALEVYASPSRLVIVAVDADAGVPVALSLLDDGAILVTADELVPPRVDVLVSTAPPPGDRGDSPLVGLVRHHVDRLDELRADGRVAVPAGPRLVADQLRAEWQAWQQLGPFIGPLLAVDRRFRPHLLRVAAPRRAIWQRGTVGAQRVVRHRFRGSPDRPGDRVGRGVEIAVDVPERPVPTSGDGPGPVRALPTSAPARWRAAPLTAER